MKTYRKPNVQLFKLLSEKHEFDQPVLTCVYILYTLGDFSSIVQIIFSFWSLKSVRAF